MTTELGLLDFCKDCTKNCCIVNNQECMFLKQGICQIQDSKPNECLIYPVNPMYNENNEIEFVIDKNCPASNHLPSEFYAHAILLGVESIKDLDPEKFKVYWKKYKEDSEQNFVKISIKEHLEELQKLINKDVNVWLKENKVISS